jgi:hypothetical protein
MEMQPGLVPPPPSRASTPASTPRQSSTVDGEPSRFSQALAEVERHRNLVRWALVVALLARLFFEFKFVSLVQNTSNLLIQLPYIGLAILSYLLVLLWLAARTRDRFGFGMALGIGVLEAAYLIGNAVMQRPFVMGTLWPPLVVAAAHVPMAVFAFQASSAYPPLDSKRPWIIGFVTALVFLAIPWVAPSIVDRLHL